LVDGSQQAFQDIVDVLGGKVNDCLEMWMSVQVVMIWTEGEQFTETNYL